MKKFTVRRLAVWFSQPVSYFIWTISIIEGNKQRTKEPRSEHEDWEQGMLPHLQKHAAFKDKRPQSNRNMFSFSGLEHNRTKPSEQTHLEESMEAGLLFFTSNNGLFAHLKEVYKWGIGLHQLFRLSKEKLSTSRR